LNFWIPIKDNVSFGAPPEKPNPNQISVSEIEETPFRQKYLSRHNETINDSVVQAVLFGIEGLDSASPKKPAEKETPPPPMIAVMKEHPESRAETRRSLDIHEKKENILTKRQMNSVRTETFGSDCEQATHKAPPIEHNHNQDLRDFQMPPRSSRKCSLPVESTNQNQNLRKKSELKKSEASVEKIGAKKISRPTPKLTETGKKKAPPIKIDFLKEYVEKINSYKVDNQQLSARVTSLQNDNQDLKDRLFNLENELHSLREIKKEDVTSAYNSQERAVFVSYLSGSYEKKSVNYFC